METYICQVSQDSTICDKFCCYRSLINNKYIYSCKTHHSDFRKTYSVNPEKFRKLLNKDQKSEWVKSIKEKIIDIESQINESIHKFNNFLQNVDFFYHKQVLMPIIQTKKLLKSSQANICETMTINEEVYQILKKGGHKKQDNEVVLLGSDILDNFNSVFPDLFNAAFAEANQRVNNNRAEARNYTMNNMEIKELKASKSVLNLKLKNAEDNEKKLIQKINELKAKNQKLKNDCNEEKKNYKDLEMKFYLQAEDIKETIYENNELKKRLDIKKQDDGKNKTSPEKNTIEKHLPIRADIVFSSKQAIKKNIERHDIDEKSKSKIIKRENKFINDSLSSGKKMNLSKSKSKKPENFEAGYDKQYMYNNKNSTDRIQLTPIATKNIKFKDEIEAFINTKTPQRHDITPTGGKQTKDSFHRNSKPYLKEKSALDKDHDHNNTKDYSVYLAYPNPNITRGNLSQHEALKNDISSKHISPNGSKRNFKLDELRISTKATYLKATDHLDYTFYHKSTRNLQKTSGREQNVILRDNLSFHTEFK